MHIVQKLIKITLHSPHISEHVDHVRYLYQFSVFIFDQLCSFFKSRILPYSFSKWLKLVDFCKKSLPSFASYLTKTIVIPNHHSSNFCSFCNSPLLMNVFISTYRRTEKVGHRGAPLLKMELSNN